MKPIIGRAGVAAMLLVAAGMLGATALAVAATVPLAPQPGFEADGGVVTQVKKGKDKNHNHAWVGIGAAIVLSTAYCAAQAESCEERYGDDSRRYWRCLRRAGCAGDDW
jgi:hypothetical protein